MRNAGKGLVADAGQASVAAGAIHPRPEGRGLPRFYGHRNQFAPDRVDAFVAWLRGMPGRGFLGRPANWPA
jgi:hypothetical protein